MKMLEAAPEEFWFAPSSYSGKYHSPDEFGMGGHVVHTKRVFRALMVLLDAEAETFDDTAMDRMLAAALVHDTLAGSTGSSDHVSTLRSYYGERVLIHPDVEMIADLAEHHMGRWSPPGLKPGETEEWLIHYADMVATKFDSLQILKDKDYSIRR
jgi:hypothetical protein